jgi:hypothetical protein
LSVAGTTIVQPLLVRRDPRVRASDAGLRAQYALARDVDALLARVQAAVSQANEARKKPGAEIAKIDAIAGKPGGQAPGGPGAPATTFTTLSWYASALADLYGSIESADAAPTADERRAWSSLRTKAEAALLAWNALAK